VDKFHADAVADIEALKSADDSAFDAAGETGVIWLVSAMTAGEKSGISPRWSIAWCAMLWSSSLPVLCFVAME